ncbi:hypothetical protein FMM79_01595 [Novosphingobium sp. BW1]|nr:hypothetical protein FMM79_01595 [Novosphingobium sp. BW1]
MCVSSSPSPSRVPERRKSTQKTELGTPCGSFALAKASHLGQVRCPCCGGTCQPAR